MTRVKATPKPLGLALVALLLPFRSACAAPAATGIGPWLTDFATYTTSGFLWNGALPAVEITAAAMSLGLLLGLGLALMRLSRARAVRGFAGVYIFIVRGTPQLLQLVFIYDALPYIGVRLDSFTTALIGFALNEAAFSAEILRGGILSVNATQSAAAVSLGMGPALSLRRIILPQAILPGRLRRQLTQPQPPQLTLATHAQPYPALWCFDTGIRLGQQPELLPCLPAMQHRCTTSK